MNEQRGAWYLLTGLLLGLIVGLVFSIGIAPVKYARIAPQSLGETYKDGYRILTAMAYDANGDIGRARARLSLLQDESSPIILAAQAQRLLAEGGRAEEARALAALGEALAAHLASTETPVPTVPPAIAETITIVPSETQPAVTQTIAAESAMPNTAGSTDIPASAQQTPITNMTPKSTPLPVSITSATFELSERREVCDLPGDISLIQLPLLQVEILDKEGLPLPGIPIHIRWEGGDEIFYTGLHPQVSPGYADFQMEEEIAYNVQAGSLGAPEMDITSVVCETEEGEVFTGALWLTFKQP